MQTQPVDIAFLDITLGTSNGITLAENLQQLFSSINIIFVTGYSDYTADAMKMHASGYITKPITKEKILHEVEDLRYPLSNGESIKSNSSGTDSVKIHTFGEYMNQYSWAEPTNAFLLKQTKS